MLTINELLDNPDLMEVGRKRVEDALIELRDRRISIIGCGNGLVVREKSGALSQVIRLTTLDAVRLFLDAVLERSNSPGDPTP